LKIVEKGKSLFIPFRLYETYEYPEHGKPKNIVWNLKTESKLEKSRFVVIGLQKNLKNSIVSFFEHCKLTNIKVILNSVIYPYDNLN
jgi:D-hexose-6-phosphate mutarotase